LEEPIFTPATKAQSGHDINISFEDMCKIIPEADARFLKETSMDIYRNAHDYAIAKGIILADTKFEFGRYEGEIILIDELLSPDSSRFWPLEDYRPGSAQMSFDKQFVRDFLNEIKWDHNPPAPALPDDIIEKTRERYLDACTRLFPGINIERFT